MIPQTESPHAVSINSTPPELLKRIFNYLLYARDLDEPTSARVDDIRSLRLTCRRFCQLASPLLISELSVSMTEASLERLRNVSSHQLIGSGVRRLHVKLPYYDRYMADNLTHFAYFHIYGMGRHLSHLKAAITSPDSPLRPSYEVPAWVNAEVLELGEEMISAWESIYTEDPDDPERDSDECIKYRNILRETHREYQLLFKAQQQMRENGVFLSSIASAMAKMPHADRLEITDGQDPHHKKDAYLVDRDYRTSLKAIMLEPHTWSDASFLYTNPDFEPPTELLHKLPVEIQRAGAALRVVEVQCSGPWTYAQLSMSPSERDSLIELLQNLQTLIFDTAGKKRGTGWYFTRQEDARDIVFDFLSTFLQAPNLEHLTIAFSEFALGSQSLIQVLAGAQNKCLRQLRLKGAALRKGELGQYLAHIKGSCNVVLESAELLDGEWADEADELRGLSGVSITVIDPFGAEFRSGQFRDMWNAEEEGMLNKYLQGSSSMNPFRNKNIS
ncbi:uncharacterized protein FMAN_14384 [Fusarium mangiferae]|uniref:F-box domain-containing protein n=1 Tax=Fusarium mangiferae TaxID=192010 RepID=A0A1L7U9S5_FUSMA|nr:uncharacterized protein FMAN_14384 [Fusarium mangiferae]CVL07478.1 uncharacterized protein FMAN_14384 [Fusarium mangiferae]